MSEFRVYMMTAAEYVVTVEADDEYEAEEKALEHAPTLCAQCSGFGIQPGITLSEEWQAYEIVWDK